MKLSELKALAQKVRVYGDSFSARNQPELLKMLGMESGMLYQELEMESPYVDTHRDVSWPGDSVMLHSHSFYELLCCRNTCGAEYLVGTDRYRLQKGDIILISPGVSHCPLLPEHMTEPYTRDVLWISNEFMDVVVQRFPEFLLENSRYSSLLRTHGTTQDTLSALFQSGVRESEQRAPGWEMAVIGNSIHLLSLLHRIFADHSAAPLKAEKPELLDRVLAYVEAHLSEKITLSDIAHHFYVSESTISQVFRKSWVSASTAASPSGGSSPPRR